MATIGLNIIQSLHAVEQDGTEPKEIEVSRGGFWARLFDPDPTLPLWQKTKKVIVQVPHYKPVMYRMMDQLIIHPALMPSLMAALEKEKSDLNNRSNVFKW